MNANESTSDERKHEFMRLLGPLRHRLMHFAIAMTRGRSEAEDLVADTVLVAFERLGEVRDERAFLAFLFTIAARTHRRKKLRARFFGEYSEASAQKLHSDGMSPEASADVQMLYLALARLPERQREAVMLFEISDLSLEDVRAIQGGSLSGVKMRISRGRDALARHLGAPSPSASLQAPRAETDDRSRRDDRSLRMRDHVSGDVDPLLNLTEAHRHA